MLTCSDDNRLRIFNAPPSVVRLATTGSKMIFDLGGGGGARGLTRTSSSSSSSISVGDDARAAADMEYESIEEEEEVEISSSLCINVGEMVYDAAWYPVMNSWAPETCCVVATTRDHPVRLFDAYTGKLRASYRSYDRVDAVVAPKSLAFAPGGGTIYCGLKDAVHVFDVSRPGRDYSAFSTATGGQPGIVSAIAFSPNGRLYACGTFGGTVGLYDAGTGICFCVTSTSSGVTHLKFGTEGDLLYVGGRGGGGASDILCFDVRALRLLFELPRAARTNQRMYFDLDYSGKLLFTGDQMGNVVVYDTVSAGLTAVAYPSSSSLGSGGSGGGSSSSRGGGASGRGGKHCSGSHGSTCGGTSSCCSGGEGVVTTEPLYTAQLHSDSCNGISLHPHLPVLATASGQRRFSVQMSMASSASSSSCESSEEEAEEEEEEEEEEGVEKKSSLITRPNQLVTPSTQSRKRRKDEGGFSKSHSDKKAIVSQAEFGYLRHNSLGIWNFGGAR